jgi:Xaa-Pro dipeptidase
MPDAAGGPGATGGVFSDPRKVAYPSIAAADRPLRSPVGEDVIAAARHYRQARIRQYLARYDCAAILMYDPMNIRYALDVANMQVWHLHNPLHYAIVCAQGPAIDFSYAKSEHVAAASDLVDEARTATPWFYLEVADQVEAYAQRWAEEVADIVTTHGGGNRRLAVDKCDPTGIAALRRLGIEIVEGQQVTEQARLIKSPAELELMRWTLRVCDACIDRLYRRSAEPGRSELEIWAELHHENIRNGGEWVETRLLTCGPRTNPWFQEASSRPTQLGELLAFDTDMIGPYGYCADVSRSWTIGHVPPSPHQRDCYRHALDQVTHNLALLRPGVSLREFNARSWRLPDRFLANSYGLAAHGVGMTDEYPSIPMHPHFDGSSHDRDDLVFEEGMVLSVESLIGERGRGECVKLETQVVIGADGPQRLDTFPWEPWQ